MMASFSKSRIGGNRVKNRSSWIAEFNGFYGKAISKQTGDLSSVKHIQALFLFHA